jgi:hypothetical protein
VTLSQQPAVRGLFQQRVCGDDALLRLIGLRFAQAGMPAEIYAGSTGEADHVLGFVPDHATRPTVHLDRGLDLLSRAAQDAVMSFVDHLGERVYGLVAHDKRGMQPRVPDLVTALRRVGDRTHGPTVFLEYAAGASLEWFADVASQIAELPRAGVCVDIGHAGLAEVRRRLAAVMPDGTHVRSDDPGLAAVVPLMQRAMDESVAAVCALIDELGATGCAVHFHLHDGHPAIRGLSDHLGFLTRLPVPFEVDGARSLPQLYGPAGLAPVLQHAVESIAGERLSLTLEIHQAQGRLPLDDEAAALFIHWRDRTNAERTNYLVSVIAANHVVTTSTLARLAEVSLGGGISAAKVPPVSVSGSSPARPGGGWARAWGSSAPLG